MKFLIVFLGLVSFGAEASLYSEFSRVSFSEVECLESSASEIECSRIQNNLMMCRTEFDVLMKNSGVKRLNISIYEKIPRDSKIFRPLTDKLNELTTKIETKRLVKEKLKELKKCE